MSNVPQELWYTKTHEWVRREEDGTVTMGITDHAQELLGDLVYVELPEAGRSVEAEKELAVVESVKAAADVDLVHQAPASISADNSLTIFSD